MSAQRMLNSLARQTPALHARILRLIVRSIERAPESFIREHRKAQSPHDSRAATPEVLAAVIQSFGESIASTLLGIIYDHRRSSMAWDFSPSQLQAPCTIWHGNDDRMMLRSTCAPPNFS